MLQYSQIFVIISGVLTVDMQVPSTNSMYLVVGAKLACAGGLFLKQAILHLICLMRSFTSTQNIIKSRRSGNDQRLRNVLKCLITRSTKVTTFPTLLILPTCVNKCFLRHHIGTKMSFFRMFEYMMLPISKQKIECYYINGMVN